MPFHFPLDLLRGSFLVRIYRRVSALRMGVPSTPELWKRCALAVRCGASGTFSARSELRLIFPQMMAFPPGCRPRVARTAERRRRLLGTGGCVRCYLSASAEESPYGLAVVFIVDILLADRAAGHIPHRWQLRVSELLFDPRSSCLDWFTDAERRWLKSGKRGLCDHVLRSVRSWAEARWRYKS